MCSGTDCSQHKEPDSWTQRRRSANDGFSRCRTSRSPSARRDGLDGDRAGTTLQEASEDGIPGRQVFPPTRSIADADPPRAERSEFRLRRGSDLDPVSRPCGPQYANQDRPDGQAPGRIASRTTSVGSATRGALRTIGPDEAGLSALSAHGDHPRLETERGDER